MYGALASAMLYYLPTAGPAGRYACGGGLGPRHDGVRRARTGNRSLSQSSAQESPGFSRGEWSIADMIAVGRTMAAILAKLRADLDNAMSNPDWSNSKRMAMVVEARNQVRAALDDAQTTAIRTAAKIRAQVDAVTAPATKGDQ